MFYFVIIDGQYHFVGADRGAAEALVIKARENKQTANMYSQVSAGLAAQLCEIEFRIAAKRKPKDEVEYYDAKSNARARPRMHR